MPIVTGHRPGLSVVRPADTMHSCPGSISPRFSRRRSQSRSSDSDSQTAVPGKRTVAVGGGADCVTSGTARLLFRPRPFGRCVALRAQLWKDSLRTLPALPALALDDVSGASHQ